MKRVYRKRHEAFTLLEVMIVVVIMILLIALALPAMDAMQASSARANAYNTLNAALQAARSYAIMNNTLTAARFQPNGKIFLVYRFDPSTPIDVAEYGEDFAVTTIAYPTSGAGIGEPNDAGLLYLPVVDREPLQLPNGYAVGDAGRLDVFEEPFYVCYRPDGTVAVGEDIWVGLVTRNGEPVNPDFNGIGEPAWDATDFRDQLGSFNTYSDYVNWKTFTDNPARLGDVSDRKLTWFHSVAAVGDPYEQAMLNDPDHFGGYIQGGAPVPTPSAIQIALFPTPEDWGKWSIVAASGDDRSSYVATEIDGSPEAYETIFINAYTGRVIRPIE